MYMLHFILNYVTNLLCSVLDVSSGVCILFHHCLIYRCIIKKTYKQQNGYVSILDILSVNYLCLSL